MGIFEEITQIQQQLIHEKSPFALTQDIDSGLPKFAHAPDTLLAMLNASRSDSMDDFLVYRDTRWSFSDFYSAVDKLAAFLQEQDVKPGDRVAIAMRNRPEWCIGFTAIVMIGAVPAPLNSFGVGCELCDAISQIDAKFLIADDLRLERILVAQPDFAIPTVCVSEEESSRGLSGNCKTICTDFIDVLSRTSKKYTQPNIHPSDPCLILFTSGATCRAKAVESSHQAVTQSIYNINYIAAISGMASPDIVQTIQSIQLPPVTLTAVPLFHVSGLHAQFLANITNQRRMVFIYKWNVEDAIALIKQEKVTVFNGAPSMVNQLIQHPEFYAQKLHQQIYGLGFGGSGINDKVLAIVQETMSDKMVGSGFGMTETNGAVSAGSGRIFNSFPKASGLISPIMQVKVVDDEGNRLPIGEVGELHVKGITLLTNYLGNDVTTPRDSEGFLSTGDIGYVDEHGLLYVVDRKKDVINRAGENISAAEVESCISLYQGVIEVCVVGMPDAQMGEEVVAVIRVESPANFSKNDLYGFCQQRLSAFKLPARIIITETALPRNPAGKLMKNIVKGSL